MRSRLKLFFLLSSISVVLFSSLKCNPNADKLDEEKLKEHLMNANRIMVKDEQKEIQEFIGRHNWEMDSTGTGLHYMIYENGSGKSPAMNDSVILSGKIFLLDASLCKEYKKESPLKFFIGRKDVPRGFEEAALLMREGARGRFIIPAHLAYGLLGDREKIPGHTALYAELELMTIKSTSQK